MNMPKLWTHFCEQKQEEITMSSPVCAHCGIKRPEEFMDASGKWSKLTSTPALDVQVGGEHYRKMTIQPAEYVHANRIPYLEGSVIYYVSRWRDKNGIEDLRKARHTLDLMIELEERGCVAPNRTR